MAWESSGQGVVGDGWIPECVALCGKMERQLLWHQSTDISCRIWWRAGLMVLCTSQTCIFNQATWVSASWNHFDLWTFTPQQGSRGVMRYTSLKLQIPQYYCPLFSCFHSSHRNLKRNKSKIELIIFVFQISSCSSILVHSKHRLLRYQSRRTESHYTFFLHLSLSFRYLQVLHPSFFPPATALFQFLYFLT